MGQMYSIALDGPSGAGKSTIAKAIAREMDYIYLDTGAMYRAFGLYAIRKGVDFSDAVKQPELEEKIKELIVGFDLDVKYIKGEQHVIVDGEDVSGLIRTPEVSIAASKVAVVPQVRMKLVEIQREIAKKNNVVMDGRDIGTFVLPNAEIKIFITASPTVRAKRRLIELQEKGQNVTFEEVYQDMLFRDNNDSSRSFAPLKRAQEAALLDTSELTLQESIEEVRRFIINKISKKN